MSDWLDLGDLKKHGEMHGSVSGEECGPKELRRLQILFSPWQRLLVEKIESVCHGVGKAFPHELTLQYAVSMMPDGCMVTGQGFPRKVFAINFYLETRTMAVRHLTSQHLNDSAVSQMRNNGIIKIMDGSRILVEYRPLLFDQEGTKFSKTQYSNPEALAQDLMQELLGF